MRRLPGRRTIGLCLALFLISLFPLAAEEPPRIGTISIQTLDVFSSEEARRGWVYRAANALHSVTRESVIRRFLLFSEGDELDEEVLAETERNLRQLPFLASALVVTGAPLDGVVDVTVVTQDAWTLQIGLSVGSVGGRFVGGVTLGERSILGTGLEASFGVGQDTERVHRQVELRDPALFAAYGTGHLLYGVNSDGGTKLLEYQRPYYSALAPWSLATQLADVQQRDAIWESGEEASVFSHEIRRLLAGYSLALSATSRNALRLGAGFDAHEDLFRPFSGYETGFRPADRHFRDLYVELETFRSDLVKLDYVNRDLRFEDFNLGRRFAFRLGISPTAFGATRTTGLARLAWDEGWRIGKQGLLLASALGQTRFSGGGVENTLLSFQLEFIRRFDTSMPQTFVSRAAVTRGWNLYPDVQLFADAASGLRAYRLHAFEGDRRILLNLEHRVFSGQEILQIVSPGAAVFADAAAIAPRGQPLTWRADAGVGLRFAITRVSSVPIVRIDVGYAFQKDPQGKKGWLLSVSGGQAF